MFLDRMATKRVSSWARHLTAYRKKHPQLSLKEQMINASKTYKKKKKQKGGALDPKKFKMPIGIAPMKPVIKIVNKSRVI